VYACQVDLPCQRAKTKHDLQPYSLINPRRRNAAPGTYTVKSSIRVSFKTSSDHPMGFLEKIPYPFVDTTKPSSAKRYERTFSRQGSAGHSYSSKLPPITTQYHWGFEPNV